MFIVTVAFARGLVVLGLMLLLRAGLVSFGQALYLLPGRVRGRRAGPLLRYLRTSSSQMLAGARGCWRRAAFVLGFLLAQLPRHLLRPADASRSP